MTDRVYPASKPAPNPSFPATKAQIYGATRPAYRPTPRRSRRSCCCSFCCWLILIIFILVVLAAIAGAVLYILYRPHRPSFTVTSLKLSYFNLTAASTLNSKLDISVTAENPNNKIDFVYHPVAISVLSGDIDIGDGSVPGFVHGKKNTTLLKASIVSSGLELDNDAASKLRSNIKVKSGLPVKVRLETKVKAEMGYLKTPKIGIRVSCDGIRVNVPTGKKPATASTSDANCKVDLRFKIWKWTI